MRVSLCVFPLAENSSLFSYCSSRVSGEEKNLSLEEADVWGMFGDAGECACAYVAVCVRVCECVCRGLVDGWACTYVCALN